MSRSQYNSSKTRVCPAFRVIKENPEPFFNLLHDKLGLRIDGLNMGKGDVTIEFADSENGEKEYPLNPNPMYLKWLLYNPDQTLIGDKLKKKKARGEKLSDSDKMRLGLLKDSKLREEGLNKIHDVAKEILEEEKYYGKDWFVLEGCSMPDVFIETNKFYMIVEGKRRETGPKIGTTWYKHRHQMVRHLEGLVCYKHAKIHREGTKANKPTYGIFIVDGCIVRKYKLERYIEDAPFRESLPHLIDDEFMREFNVANSKEIYDEIKKSFLWCRQTHNPGFVTWRQIYDRYAERSEKEIEYLKSTNPDVSYDSGEYEREEPRFEEM